MGQLNYVFCNHVASQQYIYIKVCVVCYTGCCYIYNSIIECACSLLELSLQYTVNLSGKVSYRVLLHEWYACAHPHLTECV